MRRIAWVFGCVACALGAAPVACARDAGPAPQSPARVEKQNDAAAAQETTAPPQYVVADPTRASALTVLPLGADGSGVVLEGLRFVVHGSQVRVARDVADQPIQSAWRVPQRLGGGFLFRARASLYASESFDGLLRPLVAFPTDVDSVSFGPKSLLVRTDGGERWMIDATSGRRAPIDPAGLLDVAALDDGRAVALVEGGVVLTSIDAGAHWTDASARLRSPAQRVTLVVDDAKSGAPPQEPSIWIETQTGAALRMMPGGRLAEYDAMPAARPADPLRPKDPRWREEEASIRRAIRMGAAVDEQNALVVASGDVVRVNLVTGDVDVVAAGKIPPDATCVGTRTADDVVFTCGRGNAPSFVVSHALDKSPVIEQTFPDAGRFVVGDDGGILFVGPCDRPRGAASSGVACVRAPGGSWQQVDAFDAGEAGVPSSYAVLRWIPRGDGGAIAVVYGTIGGVPNVGGIVDARTGEIRAWSNDPAAAQSRALVSATLDANRGGSAGSADVSRLADRSWTVTPQGTLRGWTNNGSVEIAVDGTSQASPFTFDRIAPAGPLALARMRDGRIWQSLDRGATWSEVASPPASRPGGWLDTRACSAIGCDVGQWYRIGWAPTPPGAMTPPTSAPPAPHVERAPSPVMTCRAAGEAKRTQVARTERSPEDLGLGAARVRPSDPNGKVDFLRVSFPRRILGPVRDTDATGDDAAPRAIVHGLATQPGDDRLVVSGPNRDIAALERQVSFVPAFDPFAPTRHAPLAMRDVMAAAIASGVARADVLRDDPVPSAVVPVTPVDAAAPADVILQATGGMVAWMRAGAQARSRVVVESGRADDVHVVSGVALGADELAWLDEDASGRARVLRIGATAAAPALAFELDPPPSSDLYPANVDALAVGPRGDLAVVRTPSGRDAPSAFDPAIVLLPGSPPQPLAPWSTLAPADDPACKSDAGGWRATIQTSATWVRLAGAADLRGNDEAPMLARVRWSAQRVCLEAVEVRTPDWAVASPQGAAAAMGGSSWGSVWDGALEAWMVARFAGGASASRLVVVAGGEMRQPYECRVAATP